MKGRVCNQFGLNRNEDLTGAHIIQNSSDPQCMPEVQPSSRESQFIPSAEVSVADSAPISISSNDGRKVSREDIEFVQNLIERCLQLYMNKEDVIKSLSSRARIEPGFANLVWRKLEEENSGFFRAYYIRLKLKKQIILFNHLLEHQCRLMKYPVAPKVPLAPLQNSVHPIPVNNLHAGYPVPQLPPIPTTGQPHLDSTSSGQSSCHVVTGVPASGNFQAIWRDCNNNTMMDSSIANGGPVIPPGNTMPSPAPAALSGNFPFTPEFTGMGVETSLPDTTFTSDVVDNMGLELRPDGCAGSNRNSLRSLAQIPWNFSLSDLTADLVNEGDFGALENSTGSLFLPSESDILLDSPEYDDIVEDFFVDSIPGSCSQLDEEKS